MRQILRGRESSKHPYQSKTLTPCEGFAALAWPANALASLLRLPDWAARDTTPVRLPPCSERLPATRPIFSALRSFPLCEGCVEGARAGGPDVDGGCDRRGAESSGAGQGLSACLSAAAAESARTRAGASITDGGAAESLGIGVLELLA